MLRPILSVLLGLVCLAASAQETARVGRLLNLSTRGHVSAGQTEIIAGFVIGGNAPRTILLRGVGPGLAPFGVTDALAQPRLRLFDREGRPLQEAFAWGGAAALDAAFDRLGAFKFAAASTDAALLVTLAPGNYTLHLGTVAGAGSALVEIYDAAVGGENSFERLINISSRGAVAGSETVLTGGFVIGGTSPRRVLVRGIGPGLAAFNVPTPLPNPRLRVFRGATLLEANDDWQDEGVFALTQAATLTGAFALGAGSRDAALLLTLGPGAYTAQIDAPPGQAGTALVEVYEVP